MESWRRHRPTRTCWYSGLVAIGAGGEAEADVAPWTARRDLVLAHGAGRPARIFVSRARRGRDDRDGGQEIFALGYGRVGPSAPRRPSIRPRWCARCSGWGQAHVRVHRHAITVDRAGRPSLQWPGMAELDTLFYRRPAPGSRTALIAVPWYAGGLGLANTARSPRCCRAPACTDDLLPPGWACPRPAVDEGVDGDARHRPEPPHRAGSLPAPVHARFTLVRA